MAETAPRPRSKRADSVTRAATSVYYALCRDVIATSNNNNNNNNSTPSMLPSCSNAAPTPTTTNNTNNNTKTTSGGVNDASKDGDPLDGNVLVTKLQQQYEALNIYLSKVLRSSFYLAVVHRLNNVAPLLHTPSLLRYVNFINMIDLFDFHLSSRLRALRNVGQIKKFFYDNMVEYLLTYVTLLYTCTDAELDVLYAEHQTVHQRLQAKSPVAMSTTTTKNDDNNTNAAAGAQEGSAANTERATMVDRIREKYEPLRFTDENALDQMCATVQKAILTGRVNNNNNKNNNNSNNSKATSRAAQEKRRKQVTELLLDAIRVACLLTIQSHSFHYLVRALFVYYMRTEVEWEVVLRFGLTVSLKVQEYYDGDQEQKLGFAERVAAAAALAREQRQQQEEQEKKRNKPNGPPQGEGGGGGEEEEAEMVCGAQLYITDPNDPNRLVEIREEQYDRVDDLIGDVVARRYHDEEELVKIREGLTSQRVLNAVRFRCQDVNRCLYYIYGLDQAEATPVKESEEVQKEKDKKRRSSSGGGGSRTRDREKLYGTVRSAKEFHQRSLDGLYTLLGQFFEQTHTKNHLHYRQHGNGDSSSYNDLLMASNSSTAVSPTLDPNTASSPTTKNSSGQKAASLSPRCSVSGCTTVPFPQSPFSIEWRRIVQESQVMDPKQFNDFSWTADAAPQSRLNSTIRNRGQPGAAAATPPPPPASTNKNADAAGGTAKKGQKDTTTTTTTTTTSAKKDASKASESTRTPPPPPEEGEDDTLENCSRVGSYYVSPIQTYKGDYAMHHNKNEKEKESDGSPASKKKQKQQQQSPPKAGGAPIDAAEQEPKKRSRDKAKTDAPPVAATATAAGSSNRGEAVSMSAQTDGESAIFSEDDQAGGGGALFQDGESSPSSTMPRRARGGDGGEGDARNLAQSTHIASSFENTYAQVKRRTSANTATTRAPADGTTTTTTAFEAAIQPHEALFQKYSHLADDTELHILTLLHHHQNYLFVWMLQRCMVCVIAAHEEGWDGASAAVPTKKRSSSLSTPQPSTEGGSLEKDDDQKPRHVDGTKKEQKKKKAKQNGVGEREEGGEGATAEKTAEKKKAGCACVVM